MKEDFLHYIWQNQKFDFVNLETTQGDSLQILNKGNYLQQTGPDFFNAQIILGNQKWAGNIEIHLKSSDWYLHHHQADANYDNIILHVVWEYDIEVLRKDKTEIPVLELKNYVPSNLINLYQNLKATKSWINCENEINTVPEFLFKNWLERLYFERLERKAKPIIELWEQNQNDWEATLFAFLAKNFGLNTNGESFLEIAKSIPFTVIRKEAFDVRYLEALLFGQSGLIPNLPQDNYPKELKAWYEYLILKYSINKAECVPVQFYKLRPDNFPTIRLAQLAMLYQTHKNLFSKIINLKNIQECYQLFDVSVSEYWQTHYNFDKPSKHKDKSLSRSFIDLLIINTIVPFKFAYATSQGKELSEEFIFWLEQIQSEKNAIIEKFKYFDIVSKNAFDSQTLLQLKTEYCDKGKCLNCAIGLELLKN